MSRREVLVPEETSPVTITLFSVPKSLKLINASLGVQDGLEQIGEVGDEVTIPASEISQNSAKVPAKDRTVVVPEGQVAIKLIFDGEINYKAFWSKYVELEEDYFRKRFQTK